MSIIGKKEIDRRFESHPVDDDQKALIESCRAKFKALAMFIDKNVQNPRDAASALTLLEQTSFFTVAGLARPLGEGPTSAPASAKAPAPAPAAAGTPEKVDGRSKAAREARAAAINAGAAPLVVDAAGTPVPAPSVPKRGPRRPLAQ